MIREMGYDGIVLESWSRWAAYGILHDPGMRNLVNIKLFCSLYRTFCIVIFWIVSSFYFWLFCYLCKENLVLGNRF